MAVKVFQGSPPQYPYENKVVWYLEEALSPLQEKFVLISNFHVRASGNPTASQIDLVIIGRDRIHLVELKSVSDAAGKPLRVSGGINGRWTKGQETIPGQNPFDQTMAAYWNLSQWLTENAGKFLSSNKTAQLRNGAFKDIKKFVVLWPNKHSRSRIEIDDFKFKPFYGGVIGFDELTSRVRDHRWQSTFAAPFEPGEMVKLATALGCEPLVEENAHAPTPSPPSEGGEQQRKPVKQPKQPDARKPVRGEGRAREKGSKQGPGSQTSKPPQPKPPVQKPDPKSASVPIGWVLALIGSFAILSLVLWAALDFDKRVTTKDQFGTQHSRVLVIESVRTYRDRWIYLNASNSDLAIEIFGISPEDLAARKKYYENFIGKKVVVEGLIEDDRHGRPQIRVPDSEAETRLRKLD